MVIAKAFEFHIDAPQKIRLCSHLNTEIPSKLKLSFGFLFPKLL
jgi:hypothetical protein